MSPPGIRPIVRAEVHPNGPRRYIFNRRIHHGLVGVVLAAVGAALSIHDRRDFPWRLRDR